MATKKNRLWSRDELIIAFNLYCKIPFGQIDQKNSAIIALANVLGRTPSSLAWKLANFARLDPALQARGIKGASHGSKGEVEVWEEFNNNWDSLAFESERLLANLTHQSVEEMNGLNEDELPKEGLERERLVRVRVNQRFFRSAVLTSYESRCCITGLAIPTLLAASHIAPWAKNPNNRMNPRNGLCLNLLHHKAFDAGLITITPEFRVRVSSTLIISSTGDVNHTLFQRYNDQSARLPRRFLPEAMLLEWHNKTIFVP
ncbi:MAG TPA: HNH endonuclease [Pyrinomonadaceae bacterium]|jgi:putative restriction endonuclease|nr:HNH endonuclease [Pyrinomonadaceae bacterium]